MPLPVTGSRVLSLRIDSASLMPFSARTYAYVLAENGINEAESILNDKTLDPVTGSGINAFDPTVFCTQTLPSGSGAFASSVYNPSPPAATGCTIQTTYDGGYV